MTETFTNPQRSMCYPKFSSLLTVGARGTWLFLATRYLRALSSPCPLSSCPGDLEATCSQWQASMMQVAYKSSLGDQALESSLGGSSPGEPSAPHPAQGSHIKLLRFGGGEGGGVFLRHHLPYLHSYSTNFWISQIRFCQGNKLTLKSKWLNITKAYFLWCVIS